MSRQEARRREYLHTEELRHGEPVWDTVFSLDWTPNEKRVFDMLRGNGNVPIAHQDLFTGRANPGAIDRKFERLGYSYRMFSPERSARYSRFPVRQRTWKVGFKRTLLYIFYDEWVNAGDGGNRITSTVGVPMYSFWNAYYEYVGAVLYVDPDKASHPDILKLKKQAWGQVTVITDYKAVRRGGLIGLAFDSIRILELAAGKNISITSEYPRKVFAEDVL